MGTRTGTHDGTHPRCRACGTNPRGRAKAADRDLRAQFGSDRAPAGNLGNILQGTMMMSRPAVAPLPEPLRLAIETVEIVAGKPMSVGCLELVRRHVMELGMEATIAALHRSAVDLQRETSR